METTQEKSRVMELVQQGKVSPEEAIRLLEALEGPRPARGFSPPPAQATSPAQMLRIRVDSQEIRVNVNVPVALAKFASQFVPPDARDQMKLQGIDLVQILDLLKGELPEGKLVDVEITDMARMSSEGEGSKLSGPMRITIEVI